MVECPTDAEVEKARTARDTKAILLFHRRVLMYLKIYEPSELSPPREAIHKIKKGMIEL